MVYPIKRYYSGKRGEALNSTVGIEKLIYN